MLRRARYAMPQKATLIRLSVSSNAVGASDAPVEIQRRSSCGSTLMLMTAQRRLLSTTAGGSREGNLQETDGGPYCGEDIWDQPYMYRGVDLRHTSWAKMTPLMRACYVGNYKVATALVAEGVDIHEEDELALIYAARENHAEIVKLLVDHGADVCEADDCGGTPLMYAAGNGNTELVRFLLAQGADADAMDADGETALSYAVVSGGRVATILLLDRSASTDKERVESLLIEASGRGDAEMVTLLLDRGANIEAADYSGATALQRATENGHIDVVTMLLDRGAKSDSFRKR